jgi:hypothetical protein
LSSIFIRGFQLGYLGLAGAEKFVEQRDLAPKLVDLFG